MDIIEWAKSQTKGGSFLAFPNCTSLPENDLYFAGTLFVNAKGDTWSISAICVTTGITYTNASSSAGSVWTGWQPLATATPPQEFDLPLVEGLTALHPSTYRKDQFSVVTVGGAISGDMIIGKGIATLPAGFRPSEVIERDATFISSMGRIAGSIQVNLSGEITLNNNTNITAVFFELSFISS